MTAWPMVRVMMGILTAITVAVMMWVVVTVTAGRMTG